MSGGDSATHRAQSEPGHSPLLRAPRPSGRSSWPPTSRHTLVDPPVVLRNLLGRHPAPSAEYRLPPLAVMEQRIARSGLVSPCPPGSMVEKWRRARETPAASRFLLAGCEGGDPGAQVDRLLLEEDPHAVLAGIKVAALAVDARRAVLCLRAEHVRAQRTVAAAIEEATHAGWLDGLQVAVVASIGSWACGPEVGLTRAGEGFAGRPALIESVEVLAALPFIARTGRGGDSRAFAISGAVQRPGVVEAPLGISLAELLDRSTGGPPPGSRWKMALIGGTGGRVLPAAMFDTRLSEDSLPGMGHGSVVVLDESVTARQLFDHLAVWAVSGSCGSCTPCRVGTRTLSTRRDRPALERSLDVLEMGSLCSFGQRVSRPIRDLLKHFGTELWPERG